MAFLNEDDLNKNLKAVDPMVFERLNGYAVLGVSVSLFLSSLKSYVVFKSNINQLIKH
jgi:hypothetical protein